MCSTARRQAGSWAILGFAACLAAPGAAMARTPAADSTRGPLFAPAPGSRDRFACSLLTRPYEDDLIPFTNLRPAPTDLAQLDALGNWVGDNPADSADISLVDAQRAAESSEIPAEEKEVLVPPAAGVQVGIPGPGPAIAAALGGLALLAKVLADLVR